MRILYKGTGIGLAVLFMLFYAFLGYKAYAVEPETQAIIDNANALQQKVSALQSTKTTTCGWDKVSNAVINGVAVGDPINIPDDPSTPDKDETGNSCYVITYTKLP